MRFRDLSQSAVQSLWDRWKNHIRELLDEFNEDVFDGRGKISENGWKERLYLSLEAKNGCLYIFPLSGDKLCLRLYKHKPEKADLSAVAALSEDGEKNYVGGFQVSVDMCEENRSHIKRDFRQGMEWALRIIYREAWTSLLC